jgi:predicted LPLAT superfamily acyltransferase
LLGRRASLAWLWPAAFYFTLRRKPERVASQTFFRHLTGKPGSLWQVTRHLHSFSVVQLDRVHLLSGRTNRLDVHIDPQGLERLRHVIGLNRGALLVGSHLGSYDALRAFSTVWPHIKVRVVMDAEQTPAASLILHKLNPDLAAGIINPRRDGLSTALAIKEALDERALVTMLADRGRPGNDMLQVDFLGAKAPFPTAPWLIAAMFKIPVLLCFGLYRGGTRYELHFELFSENLTLNRAHRQAELQAAMQRYADRLAHYTRMAPYNWFNFYDFWNSDPPPAATQQAEIGQASTRRDSTRDAAATSGH